MWDPTTIFWTIIGAFIGFVLGLIVTIFLRIRDNNFDKIDYMKAINDYANKVFNELMTKSIEKKRMIG
ncbi:hypothetical protein C8E03_108156 [Lachnotalea glycerini]|uniref:Uncharacterized protein n=1 Tax=Lachnotalea glycerini TaxID=1763509 RepID=A0A318EPK3_9FIRM|nr:hypothetical protein [Lachnotalea glycerini]OYP00843.1 hypothetical protein CG709_11435 [Lachnotalea glycerini]PXV88429.1 hypothetical protein C8E03_108156 [Lachnotalea glycerini]